MQTQCIQIFVQFIFVIKYLLCLVCRLCCVFVLICLIFGNFIRKKLSLLIVRDDYNSMVHYYTVCILVPDW